VIALALTVFSATATVLDGLRSAPGVFAVDGGFVITSADAPTIFSSQVEMDMLASLDASENISGASPEVFAFSSWDDVSFVVRGVDLERLNCTGPGLRGLTLSGALNPEGSRWALLGARLHDRLSVALPQTIPLLGAYSDRIAFADVVGSFGTGTPLDDEMLVSLELARFLSGTPADKASIIRVSTMEPGWLAELLSPKSARFVLHDLESSRACVAEDETFELRVTVRNWGGLKGEAVVRFQDGDALLSERTVQLDASESATIREMCELEGVGLHAITASLSGDFPVSLLANVTVLQPYLAISCPSSVVIGSELDATVTTYSGEVAAGAIVNFSGISAVADANGAVSFVPGTAGTFSMSAQLEGYLEAECSVSVLDPGSFPQEFLPAVTRFTITPLVVSEDQAANGLVVVQNLGALSGSYELAVRVDSLTYTTLHFELGGLETVSAWVGISGLGPGRHAVQAGTFSVEIRVESWISEDMDLIQLVLRYGGSTSLSSAGAVPIYQAAKISEGNISVALFAMGAVSAALAALATASVISKELNEGRRRLGVLKTIGASSADVRRLVLPQALAYCLAGASVGIASGTAVALALSGSGAFVIFGHQFALDLEPGLLVLILVGSVAIGVASALASVMSIARGTAIASIRRIEEEPTGRVDVDALLGED